MASLIAPAVAAAAPLVVDGIKTLIKAAAPKKVKKQKQKKRGSSRKILDIVRNDVNEAEGSDVVATKGVSVLGHSSPFAQGTTTRSDFKMVDNKTGPFSNHFEDGCYIECVEYLGDISMVNFVGTSVPKGTTLGQYYIHPRTIPSSRLDLMARNYTHYYIQHVEVVYEPIVAATTPGALVIGLVEDPMLIFAEGEKGIRQLLETKDAVMFPVWQIQTLNHKMNNRTLPLVTRVGGSDMNLIFQGKIVCKAASDLTETTGPLGNLVLKYKIHFYGNYLSQQIDPIIEYDDVKLNSASDAFPDYFAPEDALFFMQGSTPVFVNDKAYDRIVGVQAQIAFDCKIGSSTTVYNIPAGRMLYAEVYPSYAPSGVVQAIGPLWLSKEALLQRDDTERVKSVNPMGSTQIASLSITVWDLDYEYSHVNGSATKAAVAHARVLKTEKVATKVRKNFDLKIVVPETRQGDVAFHQQYPETRAATSTGTAEYNNIRSPVSQTSLGRPVHTMEMKGAEIKTFYI